jgi:hypothetical protein
MIGTLGARPEKQIRLLSFGGGILDLGRYLSDTEAESYLRALSLLRDHHKAAALIEITRRNLKAFSSTKLERGRLIPDRGKHSTIQRESEIEMNRLFLNFLTSVRQFLDHTETRLKRLYEHSPDVYETFRDQTIKAFDRSLAYRFLYKLRNFSQHCGAPIGIVEHESKAIGKSGVVSHQLHLLFNAPQLLLEGGDTWGPVKRDLERINGVFPIDPLPEAAMKELEEIWERVRSAEKPHLAKAADITVRQVDEIKKPKMNPAVVRAWHRKESTSFEFLIPPTETLRWLGHSVFKDPM